MWSVSSPNIASNKLRELIATKNLPMGSTPSGQAWCLKALHPAEPLVTSDGIPDQTSMSTVVQNYAQSYTVTNPLAGIHVGSWGFDLFIYPHPYIFGSLRIRDAAGTVSWQIILNNQVNGTTAGEKGAAFTQLVQRYRLAYLGVTGYHNAAAMVNNGLVACAQYMDTPAYMSMATVPGAMDRLHETWPTVPRTFEQMQSMPNAYLGAAKDGFYAPFRLSETSQDWQAAADLVIHEQQEYSATLVGHAAVALPVGALPPGYPYGLMGSYAPPGEAFVHGPLIHRRSDCGLIHVGVHQIAADASFMFYIRSGWETEVLPGSTYTSFAQTSPVYDATALASYFAVSRELKDAYPADYNDLGKILDVIRRAAAVALPVIGGMVPGMSGVGNMAGQFLTAIGTKRNSAGRSAPDLGSTMPTGDTTSAATMDRVAKAISSANQVARTSVKKKKKKVPAKNKIKVRR